MSPFNSLTFNIAGVPGGITPGHSLWDRPLSGRSSEFSGRAADSNEDWTIGEYLLAARDFISRQQVLNEAAAVLKPDCEEPSAWDVSLGLQKHGAFYHPIKLSVSIKGAPASESFVLNGAVSAHGRDLTAREGELFSHLEARLPFDATPRVYAAGEVRRSAGTAAFLMARWLEGYYEFHRTMEGGAGATVVWRPGAGHLYLTLDQALPAYENIARILTLAYDLESGAQVLFWHHAAGDFIVSPDKKDLPVKLITIREYGSMCDEAILAQGPLPGLFLFFVNLCLRMQLDRLDGVGDPVFLGPDVLAATARGFLKGLGTPADGQEGVPLQKLWAFFGTFSGEQVFMALEQVLGAWPPSPSERGIIAGKIIDFAVQIRRLFKSKGFFDFY